MNWAAWLSESGLEQRLVYEYSLRFAENQLEEDDIFYFDHEFLQSMGISIAKHRLEILKLARREKESNGTNAIKKVFVRMRKTKKSLGTYVKKWVWRRNSSLAVIPKSARISGSMRRSVSKRKNIEPMANQERLLITNGSPLLSPGFNIQSMKGDAYAFKVDDEKEDEETERYTESQEIKWDSMFQNLKPT